MKDIKFTANAIQVEVTLTRAAAALNSTEYVAGHSSHQWCFGKDCLVSDEDARSFASLSTSEAYANAVAARQRAQDVAARTRAQRVQSRLGNSKVRQSDSPCDLSRPPSWSRWGERFFLWAIVVDFAVDIKRPAVQAGVDLVGRCSQRSSRIRRPGTREDSLESHRRTSLEAQPPCREITPTKRFHYECTAGEDPSTWKSLTDLIS